MEALIILDHGSRKPTAHLELMDFVARLRADEPEWIIEGAHLELADPRFPEVLEGVVQQGATSVKVLPWFLATGMHLNEDVPELMDNARTHHPEVKFELLKHLGSSTALQNIAWSLAKDS